MRRIALALILSLSAVAASATDQRISGKGRRAGIGATAAGGTYTILRQLDFESCALGTNQGKTSGDDSQLCGADDGVSWYDVVGVGSPAKYSEVISSTDCYGGTGRCMKVAIGEGFDSQSGAPKINFEDSSINNTPTTMGASVRVRFNSAMHWRNDSNNTEMLNPFFFKFFDFDNDMPLSPRGIWGFDGSGICFTSVSLSPTDGHGCNVISVKYEDLPKDTWICLVYYGEIVTGGTSRFKTWYPDVHGSTAIQNYTHNNFFVSGGNNTFRYMEFDTNQNRPDWNLNYSDSDTTQSGYGFWLDDISIFVEDPSTGGRTPSCGMH